MANAILLLRTVWGWGVKSPGLLCLSFGLLLALAQCRVLLPDAEHVSSATLTPDETAAALAALGAAPGAEAAATLPAITASGDGRFIPVLIELLYARQNGLLRHTPAQEVAALEALTGQSFGFSWPAWAEWYAQAPTAPPPGFLAWKGGWFAQLDPALGVFFDTPYPPRLQPALIQWGGVSVDGIPALDSPAHRPAADAPYMQPDEPIFGLALNGVARAYPQRILDWHEMVNDVVGGVPVSLAYCTLCGAAIAYDGRYPGRPDTILTFGSSGLLYRSNKLMYDRPTRTLWNQLTGEPVLGELAIDPTPLPLLPVVLTTWEDWVAQHPDTWVLDIETGFERDYRPGALYGAYYASAETRFPVGTRSQQLPDKALVYGLYLDLMPKAYPLEALVAAGVVNDRVGDTAVVVIAQRGVVEVASRPDSAPAAGVSLPSESGPASDFVAGGEVRAYARGERRFAPDDPAQPDRLQDTAGDLWQVTEEALVGPQGERLARIPGRLGYWFGWFAFFPQTEVYTP